jgi:hypothetical protein
VFANPFNGYITKSVSMTHCEIRPECGYVGYQLGDCLLKF